MLPRPTGCGVLPAPAGICGATRGHDVKAARHVDGIDDAVMLPASIFTTLAVRC